MIAVEDRAIQSRLKTVLWPGNAILLAHTTDTRSTDVAFMTSESNFGFHQQTTLKSTSKPLCKQDARFSLLKLTSPGVNPYVRDKRVHNHMLTAVSRCDKHW